MTASWTSGSNATPGSTAISVEAVAGERVDELLLDQRDSGGELLAAVLARRLDGAAQVVDHREQRFDDRLGGAQAQILLVAPHALAVVVELGLQTLQVVEVVVALGERLSETLAGALRTAAGPAARRRTLRCRVGDRSRLAGGSGRFGRRLGAGGFGRRAAGLGLLSLAVRLGHRPTRSLPGRPPGYGRAGKPARPRRGTPRRSPATVRAHCSSLFLASTVLCAWTSMRFGFSCSALGTVTVRMPSS